MRRLCGSWGGAVSDRYVLELLSWAKSNHDFTGLPCGGSGGGTDEERPDFMLMRSLPSETKSYGSEVLLWAGEHKKSKKPYARFNTRKDEIGELVSFCEGTPFSPLLAARFTRDMHHYLVPVGSDYLRETDSGVVVLDQPDHPAKFPGWVVGREKLLYPLGRNDVTENDREKTPSTFE